MTALRTRGAQRQRASLAVDQATQPWMAFFVRGVALAVPVRRILEVLSEKTLTPDPEAPPPLLGYATGQDGRIAVMDLACRLELGDQVELEEEARIRRELVTTTAKILVVSAAGRRIGLWAEELAGMVPIREGAVQVLPRDLWAAGTEHLMGVYPMAVAASKEAEVEEDAVEDYEAPLADGWWTLLEIDSLVGSPLREAGS